MYVLDDENEKPRKNNEKPLRELTFRSFSLVFHFLHIISRTFICYSVWPKQANNRPANNEDKDSVPVPQLYRSVYFLPPENRAIKLRNPFSQCFFLFSFH